MAGGVSQVHFSLASSLHPTCESQTLPGATRAKQRLPTTLQLGPLTFEGKGSDHLGLNGKMATSKAAGKQLLGLVQLLDIPSAPNH